MRKVLNKNELWSVISKIVNIVCNALVFILLAKFLSNSDVALWYLFCAIFAVIGIIEGGFMQVISRHITYIIEGKKSHKGINVHDFIKINNRIFYILLLIISIASLVGGTIYLNIYNKIHLSFLDYISWFIYIISGVVGLLANLKSSILLGFEKVVISQKSIILSVLARLFFVIIIIFLLNKRNLISFIFCFGISNIIQLIINNYYVNKLYIQPTSNSPDKSKFIRNIVLSDMKKMFVNIVSYNLLTSIFYMLIANYVSISYLASFGFTIQIFSYLVGVVTILITSNMPMFSAFYAKRNIKLLNIVFFKKSLFSTCLYLCGICIIILLFSNINSIVHLNTNIILDKTIIPILFYLTVEFIVGIIANYLIVSNELRQMVLSLISSLFILISTIILMRYHISLSVIYIVRGFITIVFLFVPMLVLLKNKIEIHTK